MNNEPLEREPIDRVRARLEALLKANAALRCGARSKRTAKALPGCGHAERALQASWWHAGGPRAQQAGKLETRGTFRGKPRRNGQFRARDLNGTIQLTAQ
jgi:hypothetical protein